MTHSSRCATALLAALAVLAAPIAVRTATADPQSDARQHYQKGKQLFDSGDYRGAMAEFATADKLAPSPLLEFNIALCHERLGERSEAVRRYRLYLDRVPDARNRPEVEAKIQKLESELKAESAPPPPPAEGAPPADEGAPPPPPAEGAPAPAPTGDPDLDRVAGIDVGKVRSEREGGAAGDASAAPPASGPDEGAGSAEPPADDGGRKASKPIYKQWWFWVVAGVSAIILIDIATAGSDDDDSAASRFMPQPGARDMGTAGGGAVLLRF